MCDSATAVDRLRTAARTNPRSTNQQSAINQQSPIGNQQSRPSPVGIDLQLATDERLGDRIAAVAGVEQRTVDALEEGRQLALVGGRNDRHAALRSWWKARIAEEVAI